MRDRHGRSRHSHAGFVPAVRFMPGLCVSGKVRRAGPVIGGAIEGNLPGINSQLLNQAGTAAGVSAAAGAGRLALAALVLRFKYRCRRFRFSALLYCLLISVFTITL